MRADVRLYGEGTAFIVSAPSRDGVLYELAHVPIERPYTWPVDATVGDYSNEFLAARDKAWELADAFNAPGPRAERARRRAGL